MGSTRIIGKGVLIVLALAGAVRGQPPAVSPSLHLRDAIGEALLHSPALSPHEDAVESARLQQRQAAAPFGLRWSPALTSGSGVDGTGMHSYGMTIGARLPTGTDLSLTGSSLAFGSGGSAFRDNGYTVEFKQPLVSLVAPVATAQLAAARSVVASSERQRDDARQELVVAVVEAYAAAVRTVQLVAAGERARDRARTLQAAASARAKVGLDTELDVLRAQLLVSQAEVSLADRRDAAAAAREQLNATIGRPLDADDPLVPGDLDVFSQLAPPPDPMSSALASRLDVADARSRIVDARRALTLARWNTMPPLDLDVEYVQRGLGSPMRGLFEPYNGWHFSLSTSYQFDRASQSTAVGVAELAVRAAQREAQNAELRATGAVRAAGRAVARADQTAAIERQARDVAERQVRLAQLRYERGVADNFAVVDAENNLFQADSACVAAEMEQALARLRLERAAGTLAVERFIR